MTYRGAIDVHARRFREAILRCPEEQLFIGLQGFPRGTCGDASYFLARYLHDLGYGWFDHVSGWRNGWSHAWLEGLGLIVDITADQFPDMDRSVFVERESSWHRTFEEDNRHEADYERYKAYPVSELHSSYQLVIAHLDPMESESRSG